MLQLAVIAKPFTVVGGDNDGGAATAPCRRLLEPSDQPPQLGVHGLDLAEVRSCRVTAAERLRRCVGCVGIEIVDPDQVRLRGGGCEVLEGPAGGLVGGPFRRTLGQAVVVHLEPAREAEASREHEGRDEGGGAVAALLELLGQHRMARGQKSCVLVDAVTGRVEPRHHRAVRRQRFRHGGVCLPEPLPAGRQPVERRSLQALGLRADRVGARRVERDQQDRWESARWPAAGRCLTVA